jgi:hypothetical protein
LRSVELVAYTGRRGIDDYLAHFVGDSWLKRNEKVRNRFPGWRGAHAPGFVFRDPPNSRGDREEGVRLTLDLASFAVGALTATLVISAALFFFIRRLADDIVTRAIQQTNATLALEEAEQRYKETQSPWHQGLQYLEQGETE